MRRRGEKRRGWCDRCFHRAKRYQLAAGRGRFLRQRRIDAQDRDGSGHPGPHNARPERRAGQQHGVGLRRQRRENRRGLLRDVLGQAARFLRRAQQIGADRMALVRGGQSKFARSILENGDVAVGRMQAGDDQLAAFE